MPNLLYLLSANDTFPTEKRIAHKRINIQQAIKYV